MRLRELTELANAQSYKEQDGEHRKHLGASVVGKPCRRQGWYIWRWVKLEMFEGRMIRLFQRGQREEPNFANVLRKMGATVWTETESGEQWRVATLNGHFGGSLDAVSEGVPFMPEGPQVDELKTHNDKKFKQLVENGLCTAKFEHFCQIQTYMNLADIPWGLYCAGNKNDDDLYFEKVQRDERHFEIILDKAAQIINSPVALPRLHNSVGYDECKYCNFKDECHFGKRDGVGKNCRTCIHSAPSENAEWVCSRGYDLLQYTADRTPNGAAECPGYKLNESIFD